MSHRAVIWGQMLLTILVGFQSQNVVGQLPSEATLPGQAAPQRELPDEATLPTMMLPPTHLVSQIRDLPAEHELPEAALPELPQLPAPPQPLPAEIRKPKGRPWLRLNMPGHTGTIRALAFTTDSQRLVSAGEDKDVHVWLKSQDRELSKREWIHERTVRWQVQRGTRGQIRCLATADDLLALAGHGAMGRNGEILLIDPATGALRRNLIDEQSGHQQVIGALTFAPGGKKHGLASIDALGHSLLWRPNETTGIWKPITLDPPDHVKYGAEVAARLEPFRRVTPIVHAGPKHVIIPTFNQWSEEDVPQWNLAICRVADGQRQTLPAESPHLSMVTALAASRDGHRLASADAYGRLFLWDLRQRTLVWSDQQRGAIISLDFGADGNRLLVGTARSPALQGQARVELFDVRDLAKPVPRFQRQVPYDVWACVISPSGERFAYSQHNGVLVHRLDRPNSPPIDLRPPIRPPLKVAFARDKPFYRIAFGTKPGTDGSARLERSFDTRRLQLGSDHAIDSRNWIQAEWWRGNWRLKVEGKSPRETVWLYRDRRKQSRLPLVPSRHGLPTAWCWVPDSKGDPRAVAVGTDVANNIYVFGLAEKGECPLIRQFRGHLAAVTSLGVSRDLRYLVSGSEDATIRIWKLQGMDRAPDLFNRWGVTWQSQGDQLVAASVGEDGPLYFRGMRDGDVLNSLAWIDEHGKRQQATDPPQMLKALREIRFDTLVVFQYARNRVPQPGFQMFPAWQQVASLFVGDDREWAYWTPAGYYDASFGGHRLFGWQVNRGEDVLPDFFLAAQFRNALERPQVMDKLLDAGSIEAAFRMARLDPPAQSQQSVVHQYWLKPQVEIIEPTDGTCLGTDRAVIRAAISIRNGQKLVPPKAFANGVIAPNPRRVEFRDVPGGHTAVYQWESRLPTDPRVMIQVVAATEDEVVDDDSVMVIRDPLPKRPPGQLYVFAVGINDYQDPQIQRLDFAAGNASRTVETLRKRSTSLYRCQTTALIDGLATRPLWDVVTDEYADQLRRRVSADDLLVVFLSGHGVRDPNTREYFYVAANARFDDIKAERYGDCLSFADFGIFSDIPCRKLVILDTCHAGAIQQPLRQRDLKAALRALQNDVVFTLTASEGNQEAFEEKEKGLGRFTARLIEALEGSADQPALGGDDDGIVTLSETIAYVKRTVADDSSNQDDLQYPTAGPVDLLEYVRVPLTRR